MKLWRLVQALPIWGTGTRDLELFPGKLLLQLLQVVIVMCISVLRTWHKFYVRVSAGGGLCKGSVFTGMALGESQ